MAMRSVSWASQATVFRNRSELPGKPRKALLAQATSPTATTRPSPALLSSSGEGEGEGAGDPDAAGEGAAPGAGDGEASFTVAATASEIGPFLSLSASYFTGGFKPRSLSAQ